MDRLDLNQMQGPGGTSSAPGKAILWGEYGVLEGVPAVVCALQARAKVALRLRLQGQDSNPGLWEIWGRGLGRWRGAWDAEHPWSKPWHMAWHALSIAPALARLGGMLNIDTEDFYADDKKLGMGSSAAVSCALVALLMALEANDGAVVKPEICAEKACLAHRAAQDGLGSGIDVWLAALGGVVVASYQGKAVPLDWPKGLAGFWVAMGTPASTHAQVSEVMAAKERDPSGWMHRRNKMERCSRAALDAWQRPMFETQKAKNLCQAAEILPHIADYGALLAELGDWAKVSVVTQEHTALAEALKKVGAVAKVSGAGGGDLAIVMTPSDSESQDAARKILHEGAWHWGPLSHDDPGVRVVLDAGGGR